MCISSIKMGVLKYYATEHYTKRLDIVQNFFLSDFIGISAAICTLEILRAI